MFQQTTLSEEVNYAFVLALNAPELVASIVKMRDFSVMLISEKWFRHKDL